MAIIQTIGRQEYKANFRWVFPYQIKQVEIFGFKQHS